MSTLKTHDSTQEGIQTFIKPINEQEAEQENTEKLGQFRKKEKCHLCERAEKPRQSSHKKSFVNHADYTSFSGTKVSHEHWWHTSVAFSKLGEDSKSQWQTGPRAKESPYVGPKHIILTRNCISPRTAKFLYS